MYSFTITDPQAERNPLVFVSPGFEHLTGHLADDVIGQNIGALLQASSTGHCWEGSWYWVSLLCACWLPWAKGR